MQCLKCNAENADVAKFCKACGEHVKLPNVEAEKEATSSQHTLKWPVYLGSFGGLVAVVGIIFLLIHSKIGSQVPSSNLGCSYEHSTEFGSYTGGFSATYVGLTADLKGGGNNSFVILAILENGECIKMSAGQSTTFINTHGVVWNEAVGNNAESMRDLRGKFLNAIALMERRPVVIVSDQGYVQIVAEYDQSAANDAVAKGALGATEAKELK